MNIKKESEKLLRFIEKASDSELDQALNKCEFGSLKDVKFGEVDGIALDDTDKEP